MPDRPSDSDGNIYVGHLVETLAEARHRAGDLPAAKETLAAAISTFDAIGRSRSRSDAGHVVIEPSGPSGE